MSALLNDAAGAAANEPSLRDELAAQFAKASDPEPVGNEPAAEPSQQLPAETPGQPRDEQGRFAAKAAEKAQEAAQAAQERQERQEQPQTAKETPEQPQAPSKPAGPPPGWPVAAKAEFDGLPPAVKDAIAKRETEISAGMQAYAGAGKYLQHAKQIGMGFGEFLDGATQALSAYQAAEQRLETDPVNALLWLCQRYNVDPRQLAGGAQTPPTGQPAADGQATPQRGGQPQPAPYQPPNLDPLLAPIRDELGQLRQIIVGERRSQTQGTVEAFFNDPANRYAENVADQMAAILQGGLVDRTKPDALQQAYDRACWADPEIRAVLIKERQQKEAADQAAKAKAAASQARQAGASVTGGPTATPPPAPPSSDDLRATLEAAFSGRI